MPLVPSTTGTACLLPENAKQLGSVATGMHPGIACIATRSIMGARIGKCVRGSAFTIAPSRRRGIPSERLNVARYNYHFIKPHVRSASKLLSIHAFKPTSYYCLSTPFSLGSLLPTLRTSAWAIALFLDHLRGLAATGPAIMHVASAPQGSRLVSNKIRTTIVAHGGHRPNRYSRGHLD